MSPCESLAAREELHQVKGSNTVRQLEFNLSSLLVDFSDGKHFFALLLERRIYKVNMDQEKLKKLQQSVRIGESTRISPLVSDCQKPYCIGFKLTHKSFHRVCTA